MKDGGEATGTPLRPVQGVFRILEPGEDIVDSRRLFSRAEEASIRSSVLSGVLSIVCPRCEGRLDVRPVPPRSDVAYVRDRILLVCNGCGRSLVLDRIQRKGSRPPP